MNNHSDYRLLFLQFCPQAQNKHQCNLDLNMPNKNLGESESNVGSLILKQATRTKNQQH